MIGITFVLLVIGFLCYGSFLNCMAYRLVHPEHPSTTRSCCPKCKQVIAWHDLIPVVSWMLLRARCRNCNRSISILYPVMELFTAVVFIGLVLYTPPRYWLGYGILFSALIVSIRTDLDTMLISRLVTVALIPVGFILSFLGLLPIGLINSILGTILGYGLLLGVATLFFVMTGKRGMGEGDFDLLAMIGSFTGFVGMWFTLLLGSVVGSVIGIILLATGKTTMSKPIPFGPFLAIGAFIYILFQNYFI